jgi:hypothetical protein
VKIITELVSHVWTNVPVLAVTAPGIDASVRFLPPVVNVTLNGRPEVIDTVRDMKLKVFADCRVAGLSATNRLSVHVYLPAGTEVNAVIEPDEVLVLREDI